jgi:carbamoyl-phosphate synthase large subunit
MVGGKLSRFGLEPELPVRHFFVKSPVFPFQKFPGADTILGPEMKSTGEVMGVADSFGLAFAKAQLATRNPIPTSGRIFISVNDQDKPQVIPIARELAELGFTLVATRGTFQALRADGIPVEKVFKVAEGRPSVVDLVKSAALDLIINTPLGRYSRRDDGVIRRAAVQHGVTCITTLSAAGAVIAGIRELRKGQVWVASLQELHQNASGQNLDSTVVGAHGHAPLPYLRRDARREAIRALPAMQIARPENRPQSGRRAPRHDLRGA